MKSPVLELLCSVALRSSFRALAKQKRSLKNMRECRTTRYGGRVVECPKCGTIKTIYNSCNQRGCPICHKRNQKLWEQRVLESLLNTNHYHLVFSVPFVFTLVWLRNKKEFMNAFFECVKKAIATITKEYGITPGCVAVFQSHGKGMCYKPHIHCALTAGGITSDGKWVELGSISYTRLTEVVQDNLVKELVRKKIPAIDIPAEKEINNREWSVYSTYFQNTAEKIIGYLSHTAQGVVINLNQDIREDADKGTVSFIENHAGKQIGTALPKTIFVERYINHIPPPHTVTTRYYGLYSNQYSTRLEQLQKEFPIEIDYDDEEVTDRCPNCHTPMDIIKILEPYEEAPSYTEFNKQDPPSKTNSFTVVSPAVF
jgi:hypothetical protein